VAQPQFVSLENNLRRKHFGNSDECNFFA
jgi:hypothetical protein